MIQRVKCPWRRDSTRSSSEKPERFNALLSVVCSVVLARPYANVAMLCPLWCWKWVFSMGSLLETVHGYVPDTRKQLHRGVGTGRFATGLERYRKL